MSTKNTGNIDRKHNAKERDGWPRTHDSGEKRHDITEADNCNPNTQKVE